MTINCQKFKLIITLLFQPLFWSLLSPNYDVLEWK